MADYGTDVAYIHDAGFLDLAAEATPFVVAPARRARGGARGA